MTEIKQTQIEALKAKIGGVLYWGSELNDKESKEKATEIVSEWIDENNILIID